MAFSKTASGFKPPVPDQDSKRVEELKTYEILDTVPEEEFDALTELAADICDMPVSLINFIDTDRQFTKSCAGSEFDDLPRSKSVCQYTIMQNHFFEVPDLAEDQRFQNMPYVKGSPHFRYYGGVPLVADNNHTIGALCVLDYKPRRMKEKGRKNLVVIANEVMARLNLRKREKSLEKLNHFKDRLMRVVGHDIRSPLTGIIGAAEFLGESETSEEERTELANLISGSAGQIKNIVSEMLDAEAVQFGKVNLNPSPEEITDLIKELIDQFQFTAKNKDIELQYVVENNIPTLSIDAHIYKRILANLISNALKFTHRGGKIQVRARFKMNEDIPDSLITVVEDEGIGMSDDQIAKLFKEKKNGGRSGTENEKSYGLGMLIVKQLVNSCKGSIKVASEVDQGTAFTIELPAMISQDTEK